MAKRFRAADTKMAKLARREQQLRSSFPISTHCIFSRIEIFATVTLNLRFVKNILIESDVENLNLLV